jgi:hypothetical protein
MSVDPFDDLDDETRDSGRPAWAGIMGIIIALVAVMVGLVIASNVIS